MDAKIHDSLFLAKLLYSFLKILGRNEAFWDEWNTSCPISVVVYPCPLQHPVFQSIFAAKSKSKTTYSVILKWSLSVFATFAFTTLKTYKS